MIRGGGERRGILITKLFTTQGKACVLFEHGKARVVDSRRAGGGEILGPLEFYYYSHLVCLQTLSGLSPFLPPPALLREQRAQFVGHKSNGDPRRGLLANQFRKIKSRSSRFTITTRNARRPAVFFNIPFPYPVRCCSVAHDNWNKKKKRIGRIERSRDSRQFSRRT